MRGRLLLPGLLVLAAAIACVSGCAGRRPPPQETPGVAASPVPAQAPAPAQVPISATAQPVAAPPVPAPLPPPVPAPLPPPEPPVSPADRAYSGGMAALREGSHERAMELFTTALKESPGMPEALKGFDDSLVALKKSGDAAYSQGKPEDAGRRWTGTLRHLNNPAAKGRSYPFTRAEVQGQIDRLTAAQMEKGLLNYRKGEIPAAINAWKTILAYDPGNAEAIRSIRTATTQLENLKKIPPVEQSP